MNHQIRETRIESSVGENNATAVDGSVINDIKALDLNEADGDMV